MTKSEQTIKPQPDPVAFIILNQPDYAEEYEKASHVRGPAPTMLGIDIQYLQIPWNNPLSADEQQKIEDLTPRFLIIPHEMEKHIADFDLLHRELFKEFLNEKYKNTELPDDLEERIECCPDYERNEVLLCGDLRLRLHESGQNLVKFFGDWDEQKRSWRLEVNSGDLSQDDYDQIKRSLGRLVREPKDGVLIFKLLVL